MKKIIISCIAIIGFLSASLAVADDSCKLPGDIDEGEWYQIEFAGGGDRQLVKIIDIDDCWIEVERYNTGGKNWYYSIHQIRLFIPKDVK